MPTKKDIKHLANLPKVKIRRGDRVMIITGKDKGQIGVVAAVSAKEGKVLVVQESTEKDGEFIPLNAAIKHRKARYQGEKSARVRIPVPLHISNVMVLDPKDNKPTRVGRVVEDGKIVRVAKRSGQHIKDGELESK